MSAHHQELITAASGLNMSLIEDSKASKRLSAGLMAARHAAPPGGADLFASSSPSFAVIQALVVLLTKPSMTQLHKSNSYAETLKR